MKNTDFLNLELPEREDKIKVDLLTSDFEKIEVATANHYIKQVLEVDGTATIVGSVGPYVQLENLTDNILNVNIGDEIVVLMKGDNRKIRTITNANFGIVTSGAVKVTYYINAQTYADENFYKKEKVDELLKNVEATIEVDTELSETSENPVQNKAITQELANYATTAEVESKVTEKVAEIVAGAPEDFDTLKEMSDWLKEHEDSAAAMNSAIQKNAEDIATANTNIQKNVDDIAAVKNDVAINRTTLGTQCKNLLKPVTISQGVTKGITITVNDDGTITATGTATETFVINVGKVALKAGNYLLTGCPSDGSNETYRLDTFYDAASRHHDLGNGVKINLSSDTNITVRLVIYPAAGEVNLNFAPMIRDANIVDDSFEIYKQNLQEQINTLLARIEALETTATEGGE